MRVAAARGAGAGSARARCALALAAALLAAAVGLRAGAPEASQAAEAQPNVIVVLTDDQNVADLRVMRITRRVLVRRGVRFHRFFYNLPRCCPSRATLLTGQYAHNTGVLSNFPPNGGASAFDDSATVATALHVAGYRTAFMGKYLNGYRRQAKRDLTPPPGWDHWFASLGGKMYRFALNANGKFRRYPAKRRFYKTDVLAHLGARFVRKASGSRRPFFLLLSMRAPHGEPGRTKMPDPRPAARHWGRLSGVRLPRPPSFDERDVSDKPGPYGETPRIDRDLHRYLRERHEARLTSLLAVDELVGRVMRELHNAREVRNTYVILTSDNGFLLGEHRLRAKPFLYEEALRGPLVIRGPEVPHGTRRNQVAANIDLTPTILDAAGAAPGLEMDGISLLPGIADPSTGRGREILVKARGGVGVRTRGWMYAEHDFDGDGSADGYELYDMDADPHQLENLIGPDDTAPRTADPSQAREIDRKRQELEASLERLRDCAGTSGPSSCEG